MSLYYTHLIESGAEINLEQQRSIDFGTILAGNNAVFSFATTPEDGSILILAISVTVANRNHTDPTGSWTNLYTGSTPNPKLTVWKKIASSETNSYSITNTSGFNSIFNIIGIEIKAPSMDAYLVGSDRDSADLSTVISTVDRNVIAPEMLIAIASSPVNRTQSYSNSFVNQIDGGSIRLDAASRVYDANAANQNSIVTVHATVNVRSALISIR